MPHGGYSFTFSTLQPDHYTITPINTSDCVIIATYVTGALPRRGTDESSPQLKKRERELMFNQEMVD
jgi:hypothetical protein